MKTKKPQDPIAKEFRKMLQALIRRELPDAKSRAQATKATKINPNSLGNMLYDGKGGMDSWVTLLAYCFKLRPTQLEPLFVQIKESLRKQRKLTPDEIAWSKLGDKLSRDRRLFWCEAIQALEDIERKYQKPKRN